MSFTPEQAVDLIRRFLRDQPKFNKLIKINETDDDEIKLAINMAISDWNSTPPLLTPVGLDNFPVFDWLIVASSMFILQSAGVLNYRNEMPVQDGGIVINPWGRGPNYIGLAGMFANLVENKKREYKIAVNYSKTFGIIKSPEYMLWDYAGLHTGPAYATMGTGSGMSALPRSVDPIVNPTSPTRTDPYSFELSSWVVNPATSRYEINFYHNLNSDVDVRITDPGSGEDLRNKCGVQFVNKNMLIVHLPLAPDTRFSGQMIAFKL